LLRDGKDQYWKKKADAFVQRRSKSGSLYSSGEIADIKKGTGEWKKRVLEPWEKGAAEPRGAQTASAVPVKLLYTPADVSNADYGDQGFPGVYPYLRGIYPNMYSGRPWTMRMFSGYGTPE